MAEPNPKRRRLDQVANSGVHKPFRSPLKTKPNATNQAPLKSSPTTKSQVARIPRNDEIAFPARQESDSCLLSTATQPARLMPGFALCETPRRSYHTPQTPTSTSPAYRKAVSKAHPSLQIAALRKDISTLTQALTILAAPRDPSLPSLILKWRDISRTAADELFVAAKEKVAAAGGVTGMRAQEAEREEMRWKWEEEGRREESKVESRVRADKASASRGTSDVAREKEDEREITKREEEQGIVVRRQQLRRRETDSIWSGDEGFTMAVMLKSLGVEADLIGYDAKEDQWID